MDALTEDNLSGMALDHLGLVADTIDNLGLINLIDEKLPLERRAGAKTSMGERIAAMILNGLGFIDTRLYMFPEFLEKKPVNRLFGRELKAKWFNDDALGRCLDAVAAYGTTKLFTELSCQIGRSKGYLGRSAHFDTTTLQLSGEFFKEESADVDPDEHVPQVPLPARGYSKSKRHDLKQMVLNLATTGKANFPVWMESHSGNASDKKILPSSAKRMQDFYAQLSGVDEFLYVGDSAMYSNILPLSSDMKWLSRVPENILQAKQLVSKRSSDLSWHELTDGYSYTVTESNYGSVQQRWVLIFSEQAYKREIKTLERNIEKEKKALDKEWWHLGNKLFACAEDAKKAAKQLSKKGKYHITHYEVSAETGHKGVGRPKKGSEPEVLGARVSFTIREDADKIATVRMKKGRFILATNQLDRNLLPDEEVLHEYKAQSGTESGFKFIKDSSFELDSVYLKTPARIDALMMVMTLCLMTYGVSQYELRAALEREKKTLPDQRRKPTNKPSMKWIYFLFSGVHELTIDIGGELRNLVINVNALLKEIIGYFGPRAREIYLNST
jgi:transposase